MERKLTKKETGMLMEILAIRGRFSDGPAAIRILEELLKLLYRSELVHIFGGSALSTAQPIPAGPDPAELVAKLTSSVEELERSVRLDGYLRNAKIRYIYELVVKTESDMLKSPLVGGRMTLKEIKELLAPMGLRLGMTFDEATLAAVRAEIARQEAAGT